MCVIQLNTSTLETFTSATHCYGLKILKKNLFETQRKKKKKDSVKTKNPPKKWLP